MTSTAISFTRWDGSWAVRVPGSYTAYTGTVVDVVKAGGATSKIELGKVLKRFADATIVQIVRDMTPRAAAPARTERPAASAPAPAKPAKRRVLVPASAVAGDMGEGFDGFGKVFCMGDEDACVYGLSPDLGGPKVKYAYYKG